MNLQPIYTLAKFGRKALPTALSVAGCGGVVATAVLAERAGRERERSGAEKLTPQEAVRLYAKPVITGAVTIGCIMTGDRLHARRYAALAGAASILQSNYDGLKKQVASVAGTLKNERTGETRPATGAELERQHRENRDYIVAAERQCELAKRGIYPVDTGTGDVLWYEPISRIWFIASEEHVKEAEYYLNRNFTLRGDAPMNEFLRFLEIGDIPSMEQLGWDSYLGETLYGYSWIDFVHKDKELPGGLKFTQIVYPFEPHLSER